MSLGTASRRYLSIGRSSWLGYAGPSPSPTQLPPTTSCLLTWKLGLPYSFTHSFMHSLPHSGP